MPAPFATLRMRQWVDSTRGPGIHLTPKQSSVLFVFFVVFIDQAGESLVLPILSRCAHDFDEPISKVGLLFSSTAGAMALSNLWLPMCADRYGRKAALIISLVHLLFLSLCKPYKLISEDYFAAGVSFALVCVFAHAAASRPPPHHSATTPQQQHQTDPHPRPSHSSSSGGSTAASI